MYTSDQCLKAMGLFPLAHLPDRAGFKFKGYTRACQFVDCYVGIEFGMHKVFGHPFSDLIGWKHAAADAVDWTLQTR
jgi:hypothetical protein